MDDASGTLHGGEEERHLLESLPGGVIAVDDQDVVIFASKAIEPLLGWCDDLVGQQLLAIIPRRLWNRHLEGFTRYVSTGVSHLEGKSVRVPALRKDQKEVDVDLRIRVFRRPDGTKLAVATVAAAGTQKLSDLVLIEKAFHKRAYELV